MTDQMSFVDAMLGPGIGSNDKLARIDALIDWQPLCEIVAGLRPAQTGRRPYASLSMLKALYLQALYDLSDPGLEEALLDRLSFRRFCGFTLDGATPDETTICRFRAAIGEAGLMQACFAEINRQLEQRGVILKKGTLMDATIIAATRRPSTAIGPMNTRAVANV